MSYDVTYRNRNRNLICCNRNRIIDGPNLSRFGKWRTLIGQKSSKFWSSLTLMVCICSSYIHLPFFRKVGPDACSGSKTLRLRWAFESLKPSQHAGCATTLAPRRVITSSAARGRGTRGRRHEVRRHTEAAG